MLNTLRVLGIISGKHLFSLLWACELVQGQFESRTVNEVELLSFVDGV